jgi:hypothetical protein
VAAATVTVVLLLVLLVMVVVLMAETSGVWRGRLCVKLLRNDSAGLWEQGNKQFRDDVVTG